MPQDITDADAFTDPIVIPADADPADLTYVETLAQGLSNRTRNLHNRTTDIEGRIVSDEWTYPSVKSRTIEIVPIVGVQGTIGISDWSSINRYDVTSQANGSLLFFDLGLYVPSGGIITEVQVMVKPGAVRSLGSRMFLVLDDGVPNWGAPGTPTVNSLAVVQDDGTTGDQVISASASSSPAWSNVTVARGTNGYSLYVQAGSDGGAHNADKVNAIRVLFDDPGPRNS